ncbi:MAG TPA: DUF4350 domain-containing protein [Ornithinibacter sp.]|nr:DUF4350 domain-containing protein [Ornithinibacter sp.]
MTGVRTEDRTDTTASSSTEWRGHPRVRRVTAYVGVVLLGVALLVLLALSATRPTAPLDPEGAGREGGMALAEVLRDQGVDVEVVRSIGALEATAPDPSTTVLLAEPVNLGPGATRRLADASETAGRLVLVGVTSEQLMLMGLPLGSFPGSAEGLVARCSSEVARDADVVSVLDTRYLLHEGSPLNGATRCFDLPEPDSTTGEPAPDGAYGSGLLELPSTTDRPETVIVGVGPSWTNELVAQDSNAAVALRSLGATPRLLWYQPGEGDLTAPGPLGGGEGSEPLWPRWTGPAVTVVGLAVVLLALSRGRRLGRLVREPLPVVVRAIETTESRGRLYRRAGDRGRAAQVLRAGTAARLSRRLAVPPGAAPTTLVHAVSTTAGREPADVGAILFGPTPHDDASLIHLAQQLTDLEERTHRP